MTRHDYRQQKTRILRELKTARNLGCKRVIADCKHRLQELEKERFDEKRMSRRYDTPTFENVMEDDAILPTLKFIVTFCDGRKEILETYNKPNVGLNRQDMERDFIESLNASKLPNVPTAIKAHVIPLRGGRMSNFELARKRVGERYEAMCLDRYPR